MKVIKVLLVLLVVGLFVSCTAAPIATRTPSKTLVTQKLFLGYVPNVQFTPIYVAIDKGYFRDQGIELTIEHSFNETDGLTRIANNNLQFGLISGEQVLLAREQGAPVIYVFRWYQHFPIGLVIPEASTITEVSQLKGHVIGVPGKYGASYIGLQALLNSAGLKETDLQAIKDIGFDTAPVFCAKQVDAAVVYIANEPEAIQKMCGPVRIIAISDHANLVSNGLVTNETTLRDHPQLVQGMTKALTQGLADTLADPKAAFTISLKYVEGLKADDTLQYQVLVNSLSLWNAPKLGYSDLRTWQLTADTLMRMGLIKSSANVDQAFTNAYLP